MPTNYTDFKTGPALVVVSVRTPDVTDSRDPSVAIKWQSCGTVTLSDARRFHNDLAEAIKLAEATERELPT